MTRLVLSLRFWFIVLLLTLALSLAGCSAPPIVRTEFQRVEVPVAVRSVPPPELLAPITLPPGLVFVSPDHQQATSALTAEGEAALTALVSEYVARIAAWNAWSAP